MSEIRRDRQVRLGRRDLIKSLASMGAGAACGAGVAMPSAVLGEGAGALGAGRGRLHHRLQSGC